MKLYKFRPLGCCEDLLRLEKILDTEEFWFSSLWEQNDSLEGVYSSDLPNTNQTFIEKDKYKICSFSSKCALNIPRMWAHYANGFRGVALEVDFDYSNGLDDLAKVSYNNNIIKLTEQDDPKFKVKKIISQKTKDWKYECEYRWIKERDEPCGIKVGKVIGIIFGRPYGNIKNEKKISEACDKIIKYNRLRELLQIKSGVKGLMIREAYLKSGRGKGPRVEIKDMP